MRTTARRLGRPPDTSSEETRERILVAARRCFAEQGYGATTNKAVAAEAGLTTGAIYHYFGSKRDLYLAVQESVQGIVYRRFRSTAEAAGDTFAEKITAVLDAAVDMNREDPSLADFLVAARTDVSRHADLRDDPRALPIARMEFFGRLTDLGIRTGELDPSDRQMVLDVVSALMMGLVSASSGDSETHARSVEGVKRLVTGKLIRPTI